MKLVRNIFKIFILSLAISILAPIAVNAATINLAIDEFRGQDSDGTYPAYGLRNQHIYKIYEINNGTKNYNKAIYCLDVSRGFGANTNEWGLNREKPYNQSLNMLDKEDAKTIKNYETNNNFNFNESDTESDYEKVLKILKNTYIEGTISKEEFLNKMIPNYSSDNFYITVKDIEVAEQLAIWHYTNEKYITNNETFAELLGNNGLTEIYTSIYSDENKTNLADIITYITESTGIEDVYDKGDGSLYTIGNHKYYNLLTQIVSGYNELYMNEEETGTQIIPNQYKGMWNRFVGINDIYKSFLKIAESADTSTIDTTIPLEMASDNAIINEENSNYIAGPFKIKKNNENYYDFNVLVTDENGNEITDYKLLDSNKNETTKTIDELVGETFFIKVSNNVTFQKIKVAYTAKYDTVSINYWIDGSKVSSTQPVAIVEKTPIPLSGEKEVTIPEKTTREVEKIWEDNDNEDGIRPTSIKVRLRAEGTNFVNEVELRQSNNWKATWTGLPKYNNGVEINYIIEEVGTIEGYTQTSRVEGNKTIITNTHVVKKSVDLALRKFISNVQGIDYDRSPTVDFTKLIPNGTSKTARYEHSKTPVGVKIGDIVTYTIRVYNEGQLDAYVGKVTDYLPEELTFISELNPTNNEIKEATEFNASYGWGLDPVTGAISTEVLSKNTDSDALQKVICNEQNRQSALLKAFDGKKLDYIDLKVKCRVNDKAKSGEKITNIAEITKYEDEQGNEIQKDRDSEPNNFPNDKKNNNYEGNGEDRGYWSGQQDDDDFERLILEQFDLALRKYISDVDGKETSLREPNPDTSKLNTKDEKNNTITTAEYNHIKTPLTVVKGSIVTYTIRVYNEGDIDGYVEEITDYLPPELEYIEKSEINEKYDWKISKDGRKATTDYLRYKYGKTDNLLKAYDETKGTLDYREVKIQCRVKDTAPYQTNITNLAQITEDCNSKGEEVEDRDSVPNDNLKLPEDKDLPKYKDNELQKLFVPGQEDDDDFEKINVVYFDLALRKIVSKAIVTNEEGQTVTETNHKFEDDPEAIVKVDLGRKKLNKLTVKFEYQIRITNEGLIEGYAKEVKDYIPEGLEFKAEDNPLWKEVSQGVITTDQLKDVLLKPGESKVVTVLLTWKNSQDNLGLKTNKAEISKDYNEFNTPDIDSRPDNKKDGEDDIDIAEVMLSIALGNAKTYMGLTLLILGTTAGGIFLIKKYVL